MRIAVCFSGQMRTGILASSNILNFIGELLSDVDFFIHTWDVDSHKTFFDEPNHMPEYTIIKLKDLNDINRIYEIYKPKLYKTENYQSFIINLEKNEVTNHYPMWHSWAESIKLKTQYEKENNFEYDVVIKMRFDIIYEPKFKLRDIINEHIDDIKNNVFFSEIIPTPNHNIYGNICIHDITFISNSNIMNNTTNFYYDVLYYHNNYYYIGHLFNKFLNKNNIIVKNLLFENTNEWTFYRKYSEDFNPITEYDKCVEVSRLLFNDDYTNIEDIKFLQYDELIKLKNKVSLVSDYLPKFLNKL